MRKETWIFHRRAGRCFLAIYAVTTWALAAPPEAETVPEQEGALSAAEPVLPPVPRFQLTHPLEDAGANSTTVPWFPEPPPAEPSGSRNPANAAASSSPDALPSLVPQLTPPPSEQAHATSVPPSPMPPAPPKIDDRSWWARWNSGLVGVSITIQTFNALMVLSFTQLPQEATGWGDPEFRGLKKNFTEGPRVDNDRFIFNYVAHPLAGSEFYIVGRNRGLNAWEGLAYSAFMSTFFEFFVESAYEQASWQDLWITPVTGIVLGELRWQAKKALEHPVTGKPESTLSKILYVILDPFDPIYNL